MKVKTCIVGLAMVLMSGETEGSKLFDQIYKAIINIFAPPAPAPRPPPAPTVKVTPAPKSTPAPTPKPTRSKTILMRSTIVPTWQEIAPAGAVKLKLVRVKEFWDELENSDLKTYSGAFATPADRAAARKTIETYYDEALKCLLVNSIAEPVAPEDFKTKMEGLTACLGKAHMPAFVVEDTNDVFPALPSYIPGNHLDADDYPVQLPDPPKPEPTIIIGGSGSTAPPVVVPASTPEQPETMTIIGGPGSTAPPVVIPAPTPEQPEPTAIIGGSGSTAPPVVIPARVPEQPSWTYNSADFQPRLRSLPDFRSLDADRNGLMSAGEWVEYVKQLDTLALNAATRANDEKGQELLTAVIAYHYKNLSRCISAVTGKSTDTTLNAAQFAELLPQLEANCAIKFRYSLNAGPPPFEWVAGKNSVVTGAQVAQWFAAQAQHARMDGSPLATEEQLAFVQCVGKELRDKKALLLGRHTFYGLMSSCTQ